MGNIISNLKYKNWLQPVVAPAMAKKYSKEFLCLSSCSYGFSDMTSEQQHETTKK